MTRVKIPLLLIFAAAIAFSCDAVDAPSPYGPVPSARQLKWERMEFIGFLHFGVNTFTDREWGNGDENESVFNPTDFDADQIVRTARDAGMKELILTCKHHDGFCLWPSAYTEHSVKNSNWENGDGDVIKAISRACRKYGLKFGVYLSPWDRNNANYATPAYIIYYRNQLRELLTHYGPISEVWFDGANGGDGYYGGARERRTIDNHTYYDWGNTWQIVRTLQPDACMFSDGGPDIRWVGNENGIAGDPCWETLDANEFGPGYGPKNHNERLNSGDRPGSNWVPVECDVSIRPGWFYHASQDGDVKTPQQLLDLYFDSVGRGQTLLLNIPPDRTGQIHDTDIKALLEFRHLRDAIFARDLAKNANVTASNIRSGDARFAPRNVIEGKSDRYWATDDSVNTPELVLDLKKLTKFNVVRLREYLPLGQRIDAFALDQWQDGKWVQFAEGTNIGNCRLLRTTAVITNKVRLRITKAPVCPALAEIGLFLEKP